MAKKNISTYLFAIAGIVFAGIIGYAVFKPEAAVDPNPVDNNPVVSEGEIDVDKLAEALTDQGVKFYYAYWCSHCEDQIEMFGDAFEKIDSLDCAVPGQQGFVQECIDAGITSVPAWVWPDGTKLTGTRPLEFLAEQVGLDLTENQVEPAGPTIQVIE